MTLRPDNSDDALSDPLVRLSPAVTVAAAAEAPRPPPFVPEGMGEAQPVDAVDAEDIIDGADNGEEGCIDPDADTASRVV